jgi:amino acid adenylation domain-containing protein
MTTTVRSFPPNGHPDDVSSSDRIGAADPIEALSALVLAVYRITLRDSVRVGYLATGTRAVSGVLVLYVGDDPLIEELVGRVGAAISELEGSDEDTLADLEVVETDFSFRLTGVLEANAVATPTMTVLPDGDVWLAAMPVAAVTAERLPQLVCIALDAVTEGPAIPLSIVDLSAATDLSLSAEWGGDGLPSAPVRCVHELVAEQSARTPEAVAVRAGETALSYRQLDAAATAVAVTLVSAGVRPGQIVGVCAERGAGLLVALLGVLKNGSAYLALDIEMPDSRMTAMLADAGVDVVLAQESLKDRLPAGLTVLPVTVAATEPFGWQPVEVTSDDIAYVSYTSGSTGEPKGVAVTHRAVARLVGANNWSRLGGDDVVLQLAPVAFDASTFEIWGCLANGGTLAVFPAGPVTTDLLADFLRDNGVRVAWLTAGLFHQMVAVQLPAFAGLRHVLAGGDVIQHDRVRRLLTAHPHLTFTNGYGPTENTTFTACWSSTGVPRGSSVPIGKPITGTRVLVLDRASRPTPVGIPGELYAAGEGLARGYHNRPAATARAFVPDPGGAPGGRLYRTGDLVRWLPDGTLEFLGRADQQVKINGFRVEPGEIEAAIVVDHRVREAVVLAQPDSAGGKRLLAYVVPHEGGDPTQLVAALRKQLRERLPSYMVPWAFSTLPRLPLNRNGKVDRSALPAARRISRDLPGDYVAPRTRLESYLAEVWGEMVGIEPVGVEDDFFELGGHSLMAGELITRLQEELSVELSAQALYLRPTIAELTESLEHDSASLTTEGHR